MTTPNIPRPTTTTTNRSSSYLASSSNTNDSNSVRPRNRRLISTDDEPTPTTSNRVTGLFSALSPSSSRNTSRAASPLPFGRSGAPSDDGSGNIGQFLNESFTQGWNSVQGLASSFLSVGDPLAKGARSSSRPGGWGISLPPKIAAGKASVNAWGPAPPSDTPGLGDVAAGSLAERESALKAAKKASILQSHDGVNGGLDVSGKHKRRNSDDVAPSTNQPEEYLVYIHKVQSSDTYAGVILRYRCREDAFRKANGLWSRDSVQTRKWLLIPVDACEIRGRPCDAPSWRNDHGVDLLAPTPLAVEERGEGTTGQNDDFFSRPIEGSQGGSGRKQEEDKPWTHVRWVKIDSLQEPVEIGRVPATATGYFPPRRKRSIRTISTLSTPRQSLDLSSTTPGSLDGRSSRRQSSFGGSRPQWMTAAGSPLSRVDSDGGESLPAWMRRPGGVGSMARHVRAPGPEKDYFNSWTSKHIPGLNIEGPSMSIMGSETAHFGFGKDSGNIVESSFEDGREASATSRQGTGLDKAAAAVETWLRGALSKRPSTPLMGGLARGAGKGSGGMPIDSIELADTGSDDGRFPLEPAAQLLGPASMGGSSSRSNGEAPVRGRATPNMHKGTKDE